MATSAQHGPARIGRRIGIAMFWFMAVFIAGTSTWSVVEEIYGRGGADDASATEVAACASKLRGLERDLREQAAQSLREQHDARRIEQWLSVWDQNYADIGSCGDLEEARLSLGDLRARTATLLEQHARRSKPLTERIRRALLRVGALPTSRPSRET